MAGPAPTTGLSAAPGLGVVDNTGDLLLIDPFKYLLSINEIGKKWPIRGIEYFAETIHSWIFPSRAAAQSATDKFEELAVAAKLEINIGGEFLYSCELRTLLAVPRDESPSELAIKGWKVHVELCAGEDWKPV